MIYIINPGKWKFFQCYKCECVFQADKDSWLEEERHYFNIDLGSENVMRYTCKCPCCKTIAEEIKDYGMKK